MRIEKLQGSHAALYLVCVFAWIQVMLRRHEARNEQQLRALSRGRVDVIPFISWRMDGASECVPLFSEGKVVAKQKIFWQQPHEQQPVKVDFLMCSRLSSSRSFGGGGARPSKRVGSGQLYVNPFLTRPYYTYSCTLTFFKTGRVGLIHIFVDRYVLSLFGLFF